METERDNGMYVAGFIGCGNMGAALAQAAARNLGKNRVLVADHHPEKLHALQEAAGAIPVSAQTAAENSRFLFLGVKPQAMPKALSEIRETLFARDRRKSPSVLVSMAAGLSLGKISEMLGIPALPAGASGISDNAPNTAIPASAGISKTHTASGNPDALSPIPMIRIMPNTPVSYGEGVILYCANSNVSPEEEAAFCRILQGTGLLRRIDESKMDMASALSGCGPAFVLMFLEAMTEGGIRLGLPAGEARLLAAQTMLGTAKLALESGKDPATLRLAVCSPAGSTIEGVTALEKRAFRFSVMEAVQESYRRTKELG